MGNEKMTKTEWLLLGLTAVFLCTLVGLAARDRNAAAQSPVVTELYAAQEEFMPDLSPLDLNSAAAEELEELPGIGSELARRIVEYREENGPFETVEELMEVSGIGEGRLAGLQDRVRVRR